MVPKQKGRKKNKNQLEKAAKEEAKALGFDESKMSKVLFFQHGSKRARILEGLKDVQSLVSPMNQDVPGLVFQKKSKMPKAFFPNEAKMSKLFSQMNPRCPKPCFSIWEMKIRLSTLWVHLENKI